MGKTLALAETLARSRMYSVTAALSFTGLVLAMQATE